MNAWITLYQRRELLFHLAARELKQRYKGSALGFLWTLLIPLFMAVIYTVFLRMLAGRGMPVEEIIIGVFAWQFTAQCVSGGLSAVTGNANLVKKVFFPRVILPAANVAANTVNYLLTLVVQFAVIMLLLGLQHQAGIRPTAALVPLLIVYQCLFNFALALLTSALNVYFRDTEHLTGVLLTAWFFMSPAMYNLSFVQRVAERWPWAANLYLLNPMALIISGYRALILPGAEFAWTPWATAGAALPLVLLAGALWLYGRLERYFADML